MPVKVSALFFWVSTQLMAYIGCVPMFECADTIKATSVSPDGFYAATLFERDCGATTNFNLQVKLQKKDENSDRDSDVLFVIEGRPDVKLTWNSDRHLKIEYSMLPSSRVFRSTKEWDDVTIEYVVLRANGRGSPGSVPGG